MMTDQAPENTGRTESAAPESRRRSVAKRFGAVLGPLFLFVGLPVALRALLERVPWSGFEQILAADSERAGRGRCRSPGVDIRMALWIECGHCKIT